MSTPVSFCIGYGPIFFSGTERAELKNTPLPQRSLSSKFFKAKTNKTSDDLYKAMDWEEFNKDAEKLWYV